MSPLVHFVRDGDSIDGNSSSLGSSSSNAPIFIAGFTIASVVILALAIFLVIRYMRRRAQAKRDDARGAAFLSVHGVVKEEEIKEPLPADLVGLKGSTFSRNNLDSNVVMPAKTLMRPDASRDEILDYYTTVGTLPRPFRPFSFALNAPQITPPSPTYSDRSSYFAPHSPTSLTPPSPTYLDGRSSRMGRPSSISSFLSVARHSFLGGGSGNHRLSTVSTISSIGGSSQKRKVRQLFDPVLPDELVVSLSEGLTVVQSYDDGWCIVGRSSVFKPDEVEMGAVPAWVFVKPLKGTRVERPVRSSSLGVSIELDAGPGSRDQVVSWSNFY